MAMYIITGSYTAAAMKGMIANPSDREKATAALVKASGGKLESYFVTTGETDFIMRVTADDLTGMLSNESQSALRECATKTGTDRVVMAWPADS